MHLEKYAKDRLKRDQKKLWLQIRARLEFEDGCKNYIYVNIYNGLKNQLKRHLSSPWSPQGSCLYIILNRLVRTQFSEQLSHLLLYFSDGWYCLENVTPSWTRLNRTIVLNIVSTVGCNIFMESIMALCNFRKTFFSILSTSSGLRVVGVIFSIWRPLCVHFWVAHHPWRITVMGPTAN